jgi:hypothetical protein
MAKVNPPTQLTLPPEVAQNPSLKKAFDDRDFIAFQLWKRSGGSSDLVSDLRESETLSDEAELADIRKIIGSGIPFTMDSTGWTMDTTLLTMDKTRQ